MRHKVLSDVRELDPVIAAHRRARHRIVFTNGCFDLLHRGHVEYLDAARRLGDVLVVGVNSDASVHGLKGDGRPLNPLCDRALVLAALASVDHVVPFADATPVALIEQIRPDVYVKGGDYHLGSLPEAAVVAAYGGEVSLLPYLPGRSATGLLSRLRTDR